MAAQNATLIGGPGTGKTTELLRILEAAKAALGGDPFSVGFTSLTRAARAEAVSRASAAWNIPPEVLQREGWFRTCHSISYRQLGIEKGQLLSESRESQLWVADALKVDVRVILDDDSGCASYAGDKAAAAALNCWEVSRARIEPLVETLKRFSAVGREPPTFAECKQFITRYEEAKRLENRVDYGDLLARYAGIKFDVDGFYEVEPGGKIPVGVKAWIFDEAQDASALVDRVCRRLASGPEVLWTYTAGDPFQAIFSFGGSDCRHFLSWHADKKRVMPKSWRCPPPILALGERCLRKMGSGYWDRQIAPADHDGVIEKAGGPAAVAAKLSPGDETLILARCNYTLDDWSSALKDRGVPFLKLKSKSDTNSIRGIKALWDLEHGQPVSGEDFAHAIEALPSRGKEGLLLERGTKSSWKLDVTKRRRNVVFPNTLDEVGMTPAMIGRLAAGRWAELVAGGERWRSAAIRWGVDLATRPLIRLGTIHAAKGMEASTVILSTSTSRKVYEAQGLDGDAFDEERRVEYVGVTRAKRRLVISSDNSDYKMSLN